MVGAEHTEIDGLYHGPQWVPRASFVDDVAQLTGKNSWVTEWQYRDARDLIADRCDVLVWLDYRFWTVTFFRLVRRTIRRRTRHEVLWNGNTEQSLLRFLVDPTHIVRWGIRTRNLYQDLVPAAATAHPQLVVVRLRTPAQLDAWIAGPLTTATHST